MVRSDRHRNYGNRCRDRLNHARDQVAAVPDVPNFHQVARATSQDKRPEHPENPVEGVIAILANEIDEDNRDAVIRQCDQAV